MPSRGKRSIPAGVDNRLEIVDEIFEFNVGYFAIRQPVAARVVSIESVVAR